MTNKNDIKYLQNDEKLCFLLIENTPLLNSHINLCSKILTLLHSSKVYVKNIFDVIQESEPKKKKTDFDIPLNY